LSLGLVGGGFLLGFFSVLTSFSNPFSIKDMDEYLMFAAACVIAGGVTGLIMCIIELIVPMTNRIRRLLFYIQVAVIGLAVIVCGIGSKLADRRSEQARQQRKQREQQIIESLANRGMSFELLSPQTASITANAAGPPVTDADLRHLNEHVYYLPSFCRLNLAGTEISDAGLKHLEHEDNGRWQHLINVLNLSGTRVTDTGLEYLKGFSRLVRLNLASTRVTDAGLKHVKGFSVLQTLDLTGTEVTDAGLEHLKRCHHLRTLNLAGTKVTDAGIEKLRRARPGCEILH